MASQVKLTAAMLTLVAAAAAAAFVFREGYLRIGDPEVTNTADSDDAASEDFIPEFYVSDLEMLVPHGKKTEKVIRADDNSALANAPYFMLLDDGRFAFGYSDDLGKTRPLFVDKEVPYRTYLYDDAIRQWELHRANVPRRSSDANGL